MPNVNQSDNFLPVMHNWENYFSHPDEGLGTTYERFILHTLFDLIDQNFDIQTVVEAPIFGMTGISGINSIWWAKRGKKVYIFDDNMKRLQLIKRIWTNLNYPVTAVLNRTESLNLKPGSIDLLWNFAAAWFIPDLADFAIKARRIARKLIFISVPNNRGIGFLLRKNLVGVPSQLHLKNLDPREIKNAFSGDGWSLWKEGLFDIPPWPDIPMKKEDILKKMGLEFFLKIVSKKSNLDQNSLKPNILDYYGNKNPELEQQVMRYSFLENFPHLFKLLWGHHRYFMFKKDV